MHALHHTYSLLNTDEKEAQMADIGSLFTQWRVSSWRETTPDFLQLSVHETSPPQNTIKLLPLQLKSLVVQIDTWIYNSSLQNKTVLR